MKPIRLVIATVLAGLLGLGGYGLYRLGERQGGADAAAVAATAPAGTAAGADGRRVLYWHDPMVPGRKFDKPGKSPFMDMQLVPVYADAGADEGTVSVSPRVQQNLGIRTAEVVSGSLAGSVEAVGSIAFNERDQAVVQARATGYVERLHVRATLDAVKKGQRLADLYVPEWIAAQEEFLAVQRMQGDGLGGLLDAARQRMRLSGMDDGQVRLVERSGKVQPRIAVVAPIDGVLVELAVREGMTVMPGATLFRISGLGTVWADADVPESQSALLRPGTAVEARAASAAGDDVPGPGAGAAAARRRRHAHRQGAHRARQPAGPAAAGHVRHHELRDRARAGAAGAERGGDPHRPAQRGDGGRGRRRVPAGRRRDRRRGRRPDRGAARTAGRPAGGGVGPVPARLGGQPARHRRPHGGLAGGRRCIGGFRSRRFRRRCRCRVRRAGPHRGGGQRRGDAVARPDTGARLGRDDDGVRRAAGRPAGRTRRRAVGRLRLQDQSPGPAGADAHRAGGHGGGFGQRTRGRLGGAPADGTRTVIAGLIRWSIANRFLVLLATLALAVAGVWSARHLPLDALPDLSDVQVIVRTTWPGQAPQIVENQVTYPLTTTMLSVPGAKTVRGFSFFGDSYVYVLFEDGTDLYWARSRVLEYLGQVQTRLPPGARASLGPDATGVGWIYSYALVDRSGRHDLGQLRALQDWFLKYELKAVPNVAEVASVGGMVRQYQVVLDPDRLRAYRLTHAKVVEAIRRGNQEGGGSVLELGEAEYMVRASGYLRTLDDFRAIPLATTDAGVAVRLGDVARVQVGPEMRRGIAELDGEGEVAGGVIVMRSGKNALQTIEAVRDKLRMLQAGLPEGVEIVPTYDRSELIERAVANLGHKLLEEFAVVAVVCFVFLFHLRSAFVAIVSLPLGILAAFVVMRWQGVNADIMSLGGIAIAIGAMVDAAVVMIENAHRHIERWRHAHPGEEPSGEAHWRVIGDAAVEVGPALFFSLLIITLSFIPVFTLEAQEGRLFSPLAFTKTYAMAAAAGLSVTLVPVLMGWLIRGRLPDEQANPLNRLLIAAYRPLLDIVLRRPWPTIAVAMILLATSLWPLQHIGGEFMPPLDEGDLLYMPSALPGLSAGKAAQLLQQTDRLIKTVPEVASVFGKAGRAETATDPAPLEMFETTIHFKPREQWRAGMTPEKLVEELDRIVKVPGLSNVWVPPIRNRIDMLATGIKSPVGVKVAGADLARIDELTARIERVVKDVPGVSSALAERLTGGRYIDVDIDRDAAARFGMNIADVQSIVAAAIGGENIGETVEGLAALPDQRALSARAARLARAAAPAAGGHRARRADRARRRGPHRGRRRAADAAQRERAPVGLGLCRHPRARPALGGAGDAARGGARGEAAAGLLDRLVGPVRVPGARHRPAASWWCRSRC